MNPITKLLRYSRGGGIRSYQCLVCGYSSYRTRNMGGMSDTRKGTGQALRNQMRKHVRESHPELLKEDEPK